MRSLFRFTCLCATALALLQAPAPAQAAGSQAEFDHTAFDQLLHDHVVEGRVDYAAFRVDPAFQSYLDQLAAFDPSTLPRNDRLAFWINAYNAYTIALILRHDEQRSIRNINKTAGFIKGYGPWKEKLATVGGTAYGLDQIEQEIIRPGFQEPRIHFALVCAARGCPPLRSEAYVGDRLDQQLDDQARSFLLRSPAKNRVDAAAGRVYLSELFKFRDYEKDFGGSKASLGRYLARFYPAGPERTLLEGGAFALEYTRYDWSLNGLAADSAGASR